MTDPAAVLTAVSVTNGSAINSITDNMLSTLTSSGDIHSVQVTLTGDTGTTIKVGATSNPGTTVTSGTAFVYDFSKNPKIYIKVTLNTESKLYTLTIADEILTTTTSTVARVGWFAARCITGDLDAYTAGGLTLPLGGFKPKFVVNVMITGGFTGFYNLETQKLIVYSSSGEASAAAISAEKFYVILME